MKAFGGVGRRRGQLRVMIRDAVRCHYDEADIERPKVIRLHRAHDEVIAA